MRQKLEVLQSLKLQETSDDIDYSEIAAAI